MAIINSENWRNVFDKFKEPRVLWQVKNENYKNKNYRNNAWKVLLEKFDISDELVLGKRQRQRKNPSNKNEFMQKAVDYLDEVKKDRGGIVKDDANVFAEGWACSFRKLNEQRKLFTKKIIDEALLMGQLNNLSLDSSISSQSFSSKLSSEESRSSTHYRFASRDTSGTSTPLHSYRFASRDTSGISTPFHNYRLSSRDASHQNIIIDNEAYFPNTHASAVVCESVDELLSDTQYS